MRAFLAHGLGLGSAHAVHRAPGAWRVDLVAATDARLT